MPALVGALALSVVMHLLLFWPNPVPRVKPVADGAPLAARLRPAGTPAEAVPQTEASRLHNAAPSAASTRRRRDVGGGAAADGAPAAAEVLPDEAGVRALRYALLRGVDSAQRPDWPAFVMTLELRVAARRVRAIRVLRGSGDMSIDAQVQAALARAAAQMRVPDSVPATPFALLIELESDGVR
ncbi:hypothetical protein [Methyloversatilis thermotolerans]|uniref:hypothetical protein n=1 Tax=Methyloversatilis thermotolerans TaxID=1346290 RepID=UPI00035C7AEE|nr:hypothetical protein [Methyloversatilis thermotolerans]